MDNLLRMSSGLEWLENYFTISEATVMLMQSSDMFGFVKQCPLEHRPGEYFNYSSGDANLVSGLIRQSMDNDQSYYELPYRELLHKIGMHNTFMETDGSGNFVSSSYSYGTTRDWARFGLLYLNNGVFAGDTVLPPGWVEYCRNEAPAKNTDGKYGIFWLDNPLPGKSYEGLPEDLFSARGFLGQRIFIIPSEKLVVVRMGYSSKNLDEEKFLKDIISSLPG
jgi:CubicO group peptidase (beta-lactamase class C family)